MKIFFGEIFWRNGVQNWIQKDVFDLYTNFHQDRSIFEKVLKFHYDGFHGAGLDPPETVNLDTKVRRLIGVGCIRIENYMHRKYGRNSHQSACDVTTRAIW